MKSTSDTILGALEDGATLTREELLDRCEASDAHVDAKLTYLRHKSEIVQVDGDDGVSRFRLPTGDERAAFENPLQILAPKATPISEIEQPKEITPRKRRTRNQVDHLPEAGTKAAPVVKQSFTTVEIPLPLDKVAAMVSIDQFRAFLHCQVLLCLSAPVGGVEELLYARGYLDRLIKTH